MNALILRLEMISNAFQISLLRDFKILFKPLTTNTISRYVVETCHRQTLLSIINPYSSNKYITPSPSS